MFVSPSLSSLSIEVCVWLLPCTSNDGEEGVASSCLAFIGNAVMFSLAPSLVRDNTSLEDEEEEEEEEEGDTISFSF